MRERQRETERDRERGYRWPSECSRYNGHERLKIIQTQLPNYKVLTFFFFIQAGFDEHYGIYRVVAP